MIYLENNEYKISLDNNEVLGFYYNGDGALATDCIFHALNLYRKTGEIQSIIKHKFDRLIENEDYLFNLSKALDSDCDLPNVKESFIPRPHQKVAIEFGKLTNGRFLIADQMRTGKSFSALLYLLTTDAKKILIVCPSKLTGVWVDMVNNICDYETKILKSNNVLENKINIISYDILHTIEDLSNIDLTIVDETHFFLKSTARRSNAIKRIESDKRIALSGTMILNSPFEILSILDWVRPDLVNEFELFLDRIRKRVDVYTLSHLLGIELRKRCLLLRETYQVGTANEPTINFINLDVKIDNPTNLQEVGKAKVDYAVEYLRSFREKILVIFYYKETGQMLKARLGDDAVLIDGMTSKKEVKNNLDKFKNNEVQYLLGSNVLGEGIDISHCNQILIVEESSHSMRIDQIRARCSNIYKEKDVQIDILIAKGTQDDRLYDILNNKFDIQDGFKDK